MTDSDKFEGLGDYLKFVITPGSANPNHLDSDPSKEQLKKALFLLR